MVQTTTPHTQSDTEFNAIAISIASPEDILRWSNGEITKPETINYRTQKPEKDGLFCQKVFGPVKNYECGCGKYKRIRYRGITCEVCGVEVTRSIVRRERMGHVKLAVPIAHTWFLRSTPSKIGLLLGLAVKKLEQVVYFASYIVVDVDDVQKEEELKKLNKEYQQVIERVKEENSQSLRAVKKALKNGEMTEDQVLEFERSLLEKVEEVNQNFDIAKRQLKSIIRGEVLTETEYREISLKFGHVFRAGIGADAVREILQKINLESFIEEMKEDYKASSGQKQKKIVKRMRLAGSFLRSNMKPEWMILTVIPVIPPDLRPMVQLDGGRFATSDLNDLYRRVINRNQRLKKLIQLGAPEIICRNEKRMLQEAVDILISNQVRNSKAGMNYVQKRKLKSLSDMLKGKQGRFRQNLLGKRVDYSGRSVIVVGPQLRLHECGLPKYIMMELFKPFVISRLIKYELVFNVKSAEKMIRLGEKIVWDVLEEVIKGKCVLLNRAPTLHRLGIQAFYPRIVEGKAIQVHPLVCPAFNADFDGDQMAVHLPLSEAAQDEARNIILSSKNILKPSSGDPVIDPSQDIVLGCYFLTEIMDGLKGEGNMFFSLDDAIYAYNVGNIDLKAKIKIRMNGEMLETSVGRVFFNQILPEGVEFQNQVFRKKSLSKLLADIYTLHGTDQTAIVADAIKDIGFKYATISGVSISAFDLYGAEDKEKMVEKADIIVDHINNQFRQGLITNDERYEHTIKIWSRVKNDVMQQMVGRYKSGNDIFTQVDSGARGNWGQITQLSGMKGLVSSPSGKTIELPIRSNLKEGFTILEYFIATHGGRKGKSDTALKTAEAGYLTRRLVDSVQDIVVREEDCKTDKYRVISRVHSAKLGIPFAKRIYGRFLAQDVVVDGKVVVTKETLIDDAILHVIEESQVESVAVYSVMYCTTLGGICQKTYGFDLSANKIVKMGTPVGIMAAQSIGEPGTQLTMRTFHMGGIATEGASITQGLTRVEEIFEARSPAAPAVVAEISGVASVKRGKNDTKIVIESRAEEDDVYELRYAMEPVVKEGDVVKEKQIIARSTESKETVKSFCAGVVKKAEDDVIIIHQNEKRQKTYSVSNRTTIRIKDGDMVKKGSALTAGHLDLRELMDLAGVDVVQDYVLNEVLNVYSSQGQDINEKHIEVIVKQMFSKVRIIDPGDTDFLPGEVKDYVECLHINNGVTDPKKKVRFERLLLGLTRVSLWTQSWLSAASFQETTRVLVDAAVSRKIDTLDGLKENVIIGRLIPAGTGYKHQK